MEIFIYVTIFYIAGAIASAIVLRPKKTHKIGYEEGYVAAWNEAKKVLDWNTGFEDGWNCAIVTVAEIATLTKDEKQAKVQNERVSSRGKNNK